MLFEWSILSFEKKKKQENKGDNDKKRALRRKRDNPALRQQEMMQPNITVMNIGQERETGRKAQLSNINAAKTVADIIRTCLGPRAMLKMLLDPMGGIVLTNDGNAILREVEVPHPAAKSMIELSRTQDEEVGDGTTSVVSLFNLDHSRWSGPCFRSSFSKQKVSSYRHHLRL